MVGRAMEKRGDKRGGIGESGCKGKEEADSEDWKSGKEVMEKKRQQGEERRRRKSMRRRKGGS